MSDFKKNCVYIALPFVGIMICIAEYRGADICILDWVKILFHTDSKKEIQSLKAEVELNPIYSFNFLDSKLRLGPINTQRSIDNEELRNIYKHIQICLCAIGYFNGTCDGDQSATYKAVIGFQLKHNLKPDGVVGPKTWKAMENEFKKKRVN